MSSHRPGDIAVIFLSQRTDADRAGYDAAAAEMTALAARQPGYRGMDSVRDGDGLGITISYWADDASARAWRVHPDHARIREAGRDRWYSRYDLVVAEISRAYDWTKS